MAKKKKSALRAAAVLRNLASLAPGANPEDETLDLDTLADQPVCMAPDSSKMLRMKKFRAQLLAHWLVGAFEPCRVADIGGGKGLLSFLLNQHGWQATVIDPVDQALPEKYKDIETGRRVKIGPDQRVARITAEFQKEMARDFDLLVGMHAHACNASIIDAAQAFGCGFVIFPCCVIDEPFYPRLGVQWIECLADYATWKAQTISPVRLNFKGQNIGLVHAGRCQRL